MKVNVFPYQGSLSIIFSGVSFLLLTQLFSLKAQIGPCKRPNVILIICDDMRYDSFSITGGPDFMNTPSIDRIANEGARFDNYYCTYSLCIPSRGSIMTGLYPHSHGAVDNCNEVHDGIVKLAEALDDVGYNTAMIGKYHIEEKLPSGWDYWLATKGDLDYTDPDFYYGKKITTISGNIEQIIYDSVHHYLNTVDTPFFINVGHLAPHRNPKPLPQYVGVFDDEKMPVPDNYFPFTNWYPSYLYNDSSKLYLQKSELKDEFQAYFESILGIEDNTTDILNILTQRNLLDNTLIIFMSDNGAIFGEHLLKGKGEAYEPSTHLPLFIRYPAWYLPNTVINGDFFALNIDIMPTILDACCIDPHPYDLQGSSLRELENGFVSRPEFLYETIKLNSGTCESVQEGDKPSSRAVLSKNYKYITHQCNQTTEEFFDLVNDPLETTNLIKNTDYASLIDSFRLKLEALRIQYQDTLSADTSFRSCYLVTLPKNLMNSISVENSLFQLSPNPAIGGLKIYSESAHSDKVAVSIYNSLGQLLYYEDCATGGNIFSKQVDVSTYPAGIYIVQLTTENNREILTLFKN